MGETARSLHERAKEHRRDAEKQSEDSHMIKHWRTDHQDQMEAPNFTFNVVASFGDALSRQVSETKDREEGE